MNEWWAALTALEKIFVALAFPFTLLTVIQLLLEILGVGGDHSGHDGAADGGTEALSLGGDVDFLHHFSFFSVRNFIYFLMMFGWMGLACSKVGLPAWLAILIAMISGLTTTLIIGWIFYVFTKLTESGNIQISNAVGKMGTVYITIPEARSGSGVIQMVIQGVTQEVNAMTNGEKLATGTSVDVSEILSGNIALVTKTELINK